MRPARRGYAPASGQRGNPSGWRTVGASEVAPPRAACHSSRSRRESLEVLCEARECAVYRRNHGDTSSTRWVLGFWLAGARALHHQPSNKKGYTMQRFRLSARLSSPLRRLRIAALPLLVIAALLIGC